MNTISRTMVLLTVAAAGLSVQQRLMADDLKASADFSAVQGKVKRLNGTNCGPCVKSDVAQPQLNADFAELGFSSVRLHDVPLVNSGVPLVDVKEIFPIWNANLDPADSANYFFDATDNYLRNIMSCSSAEIVYRLGASIEHGPVKYFARKPDDFDRYAEVCAGIVRHYVKGWAGGFKAPISHWEIWNEADGCTYSKCMWSGSWEEYIDFYVKVAKRLHSEFPEIKIGGPALTSITRWAMAEKLVERCKSENVPFDFLSFHTYPHKPLVWPDLYKAREMLDRLGFAKSEIHCNEWHYFPCSGFGEISTPEQRRRWYGTPDGMNGIDAAAFIGAMITLWQDAPVDVANYYMTHYPATVWGLYDQFGAKSPTYHSLVLVGRFLSGGTVTRVATGSSDADHCFVLGGISAEGRKRLLVSMFKPDGWTTLSIALKGMPESGKVKVTVLDSFTEPPRTMELPYSDSRLDFGAVNVSSVRLVEWN